MMVRTVYYHNIQGAIGLQSVFQVGCPEEIKDGSCPCLYK